MQVVAGGLAPGRRRLNLGWLRLRGLEVANLLRTCEGHGYEVDDGFRNDSRKHSKSLLALRLVLGTCLPLISPTSLLCSVYPYVGSTYSHLSFHLLLASRLGCPQPRLLPLKSCLPVLAPSVALPSLPCGCGRSGGVLTARGRRRRGRRSAAAVPSGSKAYSQIPHHASPEPGDDASRAGSSAGQPTQAEKGGA